MRFIDKLAKIVEKNNSLLCVGLDIDEEKIPGFLIDKFRDAKLKFNQKIIDNTKDLVCGYKINLAFYEIFGKDGLDLLNKTIEYIPKDMVMIIDGKKNDIGNTAQKYAKNIFENLKADATTLNPYLGFDGIRPFVEYQDKCSFVLCKTSNQTSVEFQDMKIENKPLYYHVANKIKEWNVNKNCGAVVGATYPEQLKEIRKILGENLPILIPGIGAQGGNIEKTVKYGANKKGKMAIINSSRAIIYAGKDKDFEQKVRKSAKTLRDTINRFR